MKRNIITVLIITAIACQSCTTLRRVIKYGSEDIYDYKIFPSTEVRAGNNPFTFKQSADTTLENLVVNAGTLYKDTVNRTLPDFLEKDGTIAFLVIRNDSILFEHYYKGHDQSKISTVFSISKSVTSLLTGIAVDEGYIESVHDPVTKYLPELAKKAPEFQQLTIEHLLDMRSGFKFKEDYKGLASLWRFAKFYYGNNQLRRIGNLKFAHEPGSEHEYLSVATAVLGAVVERATGKELGKYLEEKVWIPMGMEYNALWSIDDKKHRATKAYSGLAPTARDLAKIGRLYLNNGNWNGKQIVDSAWVARSVTPNPSNEGYQYQWYSPCFYVSNNADNRYFPDAASVEERAKAEGYQYYQAWQDPKHPDRWSLLVYYRDFYALGIMHQNLYVDPERNIIVVRLGEHFNLAGMDYYAFIYRLIRKL